MITSEAGEPTASDPTVDDVAAFRATLLAGQVARQVSKQRASGSEAMIAHLKLVIAQRQHGRFSASSERRRKLLDQTETATGTAERMLGDNTTPPAAKSIQTSTCNGTQCLGPAPNLQLRPSA